MPVCLSTVRSGQAERSEGLVDLNSASWNRIVAWLAHLDALQPMGPVRIRLDYSLPGVPS